jgi:hypothetical protein
VRQVAMIARWVASAPSESLICFAAQLTGRGYVCGTKFTPSGFFAFAHVQMRDLVDTTDIAHESLYGFRDDGKLTGIP